MPSGEPSFLLCPRVDRFLRGLVLLGVFCGLEIGVHAQGLVVDPPAGRSDGITVLSPDRAHIQLRAPGKDHVNLRGDFNDWQISTNFLMNQSTDGNIWWLEVEGLTPGAWTRYHFLIDDTLEVADPYAPLILDPWNDGYIPAASFPNRPAHPSAHAFWPVGRMASRCCLLTVPTFN